jgi:alkanesulfonate monooxygenase SsuD/methylene tetrahydromethanopterin reductase-like flavin-dependent oxidoreductase (luciferase family)
MKFGVLINHEWPRSDDLDVRMRELIRMAKAARDLGFDSCFGFQHYLASLATLQPLPVLARLIEHTGDMRLGTGIYLNMDHPVQLAENFATFDQLSDGRLTLGLGTGYRKNEFAAFGIDPKLRWTRLAESVELLKRLWSGEEVNFNGRIFTVEGATIGLVPKQRPRPPIWIGASEEKRIRQVARIADAWIVAPNVKLRWAAGHLDIYRDELVKQGVDVATHEYPIIRELSVAPTDEAAYAKANEAIRSEYHAYADYGSDHWRTMYEDLREKAFLFGSPDTVATKLRHLADAGFNNVIFRFSWSGMTIDQAFESLELFARDVRPRFERALVAG